MRKGFMVGVLMVLAVMVLTAQMPYFSSLYVRTLLQVTGKAVVTDSLRVQKTLTLGSVTAGKDAFTTTATLDTIVVSGTLAADVIMVTYLSQAALDTAECITALAGTDTIFVSRSGAAVSKVSAAAYAWFRIRK